MKIALFAVALVAAPAMAQTMPQDSAAPTTDQSTMTQQQTTPNTMPSDASMAPPVSGSNAPMTTDATGSMGGGMGATMTPPAPAPMANYPWCRPGQYNNCREHENAKGQGVRKN